jgi:hypothetical protein
MTEHKPTYTIVNRKSKAIKRPIKSLKVGAEFHALLTAMHNESDASMTIQRINELAIRAWAERYYPHTLPILTGGQIDESQRPLPFINSSD